MQGVRRDNLDDLIPNPGEYGKGSDGKWYCCAPVSPQILSGNLSNHQVVEHEDGTITVSPSILITHWTGKQWHGYLERGVWREV